MFPDNVSAILLNESNVEYALFKAAIQIARTGANVWFISPEPFKKLPENLELPSTEILKLITFLFLEGQKDVLTHINNIHMWHRIPRLIIVNGFENYCKLFCASYNAMHAAFFTAALIDAVATSSLKLLKKASLLVSCGANNSQKTRIQRLVDIYFPITITGASCVPEVIINTVLKELEEIN